MHARVCVRVTIVTALRFLFFIHRIDLLHIVHSSRKEVKIEIPIVAAAATSATAAATTTTTFLAVPLARPYTR